MMLAMPMDHSVPVILSPDTAFYGSVLKDNGRYQFKSVYKAKKIRPIPIWIATLPVDIKRVQLRSFVRLAVNLPLSLKILAEDIENEVVQNVVTHDISGGGLSILSNTPIPIDTKVELAINLGEQVNICSSGIVVRLEKRPSDLEFYLISIKFLDLIERERSKIIKFIFKKQVERKSKGF